MHTLTPRGPYSVSGVIRRWFCRRGAVDACFALARFVRERTAGRRDRRPRIGLDPLEERNPASDTLASMGVPLFGTGLLTPGWGVDRPAMGSSRVPGPTVGPRERLRAGPDGEFPAWATATPNRGRAVRPRDEDDAPRRRKDDDLFFPEGVFGFRLPGGAVTADPVSPATDGFDSPRPGSGPGALGGTDSGGPGVDNDPAGVIPGPSGPMPAGTPPTPASPGSGPAASADGPGADGDSADGGKPPPGGPLDPSSGEVIDVSDLLADGLEGWEVFESGGTAPDKGTVTVQGGDVWIAERTSFLVGLKRTVRVGANPGTIRFSYDPVQFDAAGGVLRDAFEAGVVDGAGQPLVATFVPTERDAYVNVSEGMALDPASGKELAALGAGATTTEASSGGTRTVDVDVSRLPAHGTATIVFKMVGVDTDVGSKVRIKGRHTPPTVAVVGANTLAEGSKYTLGLSAGNLHQDTVSQWVVNWGDGSAAQTVPGNPPVVVHYYPDDDPASARTISATATTSANYSATATKPITVTNVAPAVAPAANQTTTVNATLGLTATFTDPGFTSAATGTSETFTASIDWGDGKIDTPAPSVTNGGVGVATTGSVAGSHKYATPGTFTVGVTVADDDLGSTTQTFTVTVPTPTVSVGAIAGNEGSSVNLTATATGFSTAASASYTITWGDGTSNSGTASPSGGSFPIAGAHTYADNKAYAVAVAVADVNAAAATGNATSTIANVVPTVTPVANQTATAGTAITSLQVGTFTDPGFTFPTAGTSETFTASIDWGDGKVDTPAPTVTNGGVGTLTSGKVVGTHTYAYAGAYTAKVTVTDDDLGAGSGSFAVVVSAPPAPVSPIAGDEGASLAFAADAPGLDPAGTYTATITWGDTTSSAGTMSVVGNVVHVAGTHPYADNGSYPTTVTVKSGSTTVAAGAGTATIANVAPTVAPAANQTATAGVAITSLQVGTFTDPGFTFPAAGTTESFSATINWGDGKTDPVTPTWTAGSAGVLTSGKVVGTHTYAAAGTFTVTVTVTDDDLGAQSKTFTVTVASSANPPAISSVSAISKSEGVSGSYSAVFTDADGGTPSTYKAQIDWGDGTSDSVTPTAGANSTTFNVAAAHTYADNKTGNYTITLTVTDPTSLTASKTSTATITNTIPTIATVAATQYIGINLPLTVQAGTFTDPGFTFPAAGTQELFNTASFPTTIAWGDGKTDSVSPAVTNGSAGVNTTGTVTGTHTFTAAGTYTATLIVRDDDGGVSTSKTFSIVVSSKAPVLGTPAAMSGNEGASLPYSVTFTDGDNDAAATYKAVVTWGDGTSTTVTPTLSGTTYTVASSHRFADNKTGNYPVAVTVTDKYGLSATKSITATVANVAPTSPAGAAQSGKLGVPFTLTVPVFSDPGFTFPTAGTSETFTVTIDWNDGTGAQTVTPTVVNGSAGVNTTITITGTHTYLATRAVSNPYQVLVTVTDDDAGKGTVTIPVAVLAETQKVPGDPGTITVVTIDLTSLDSSAFYKNELGLYVVDSQGRVASSALLPTAAGYAAAAIDDSSRQVILPRNFQVGRVYQVTLLAGTEVAFYGIQNETTDWWRLNNSANTTLKNADGTDRPNAYFSITSANPDAQSEHFRANQLADGRIQYAFEDLDNGGDKDFNDLVFTIKYTLNEQSGATRFFVTDPNTDKTFRYNVNGTSINNTALAAANSNSRGAAGIAGGTKLWTIDSTKLVYLYDGAGASQLSWTAGGVTTPEDVAMDGTDLWVLDANTAGRKLARYSGTAQANGSTVSAAATFSLNAANTNPVGLAAYRATGSSTTRLWVTDDRATPVWNPGDPALARWNDDRVFVYDVTGAAVTFVGQWTLDPGNTSPADLTNDPTGAAPDLWVVDKVGKQVYRYAASTAWTADPGTAPTYRLATNTFGLIGGTGGVNPTGPTGIADPPPGAPAVTPDPLNVEGPLHVGDTVLVSGLIQVEAGAAPAVTANGVGAAIDATGRFFAPVLVGPNANTFKTTGVAVNAGGVSPATVTTALPNPVAGRYPDDGPYDFGAIADVSAAVRPTYGRTSFHMGTNVLYADLTAQHVGTDAIWAPLLAAVHHLSDPRVKAAGLTGVTPADAVVTGAAFYDVTTAVPGGTFEPGETTEQRVLSFADPSRVKFRHQLSFLGAVNRPPRFTSVPVLDATTSSSDLVMVTAPPVVPPGSPPASPPGSPPASPPPVSPPPVSPPPVSPPPVAPPTAPPVTPPVTPPTSPVPPSSRGKYRYQTAAADPNQGDVLTYRVVTGPEGLTISSTGLVSWDVPALTADEDFPVRLEVKDQFGRVGTQAYAITVYTNHANRPPRFNTEPVTEAFVGVPYAYDSEAPDPDGDTVRYTLVSVTDPNSQTVPGVAIDQWTGLVSWTPPADRIGQTVFVTLQANDVDKQGTNRGGVDYQKYPVQIFQPAGNGPPAIVSEPVTSLAAGGLFRYPAAAVDPDADTLSWTFVEGHWSDNSGSVAMTIDPAGGLLTWPSPTNAGGKSVVYTIRVGDGHGGFDAQTRTLALVAVAPGSIAGLVWDDLNGNAVRDFAPGPVGPPYIGPVSLFSVDEPFVPVTIAEYGPNRTLLVATLAGYFKGGGVSNSQLFEVKADGTAALYADLPGIYLNDNVAMAVAPAGNTAGFATGDTYIPAITMPGGFGGTPTIAKVTAGGGSFVPNWLTIPGASGGVLSLYIDQTGVFGNKMLALTSNGEVWEVGGDKSVTLLTNQAGFGSFADAYFTTVPNDPSKFGPLAGRVLVGADGSPARTIDPAGFVDVFTSARPDVAQDAIDAMTSSEGVRVVPGNANFFAAADGPAKIFVAAAGDFDQFANEIVFAHESGPVPISHVWWDGAMLHGAEVPFDANSQAAQPWEQIAFLPEGLGPVPEVAEPVLPNWTVYIDANQNAVLDVGELAQTVGKDGLYKFDGLVPGHYVVREVPQSGWKQTAPTPVPPGQYVIDLAAGQAVTGKDFGNQAIPLDDNHLPVLSGTPPLTAAVDERYSYRFTATDPDYDVLTFDLPVHPAGMAIHATTGQLVWTPTPTQVGPQTYVVRVSDGRGGAATLSFDVTVAPANHAPAIFSTPVGKAVETRPYAYTVVARDPDAADTLYYSVTGLPGASFNGTVLTWTPGPGASGSSPYTVAVTVRDRVTGGLTAVQTYVLTVTATGTNGAPTVTTALPDRVGAGQTYRGRIYASDPDGDPLTFTRTAGPSQLGVTADGKVTWVTTAADVNATPYSVTIRVADGQGHTVDVPFTILVTAAAPTNRPPLITSPMPTAAVVGKQLVYVPTATDPDHDPLDWAIEDGPDNLAFDPETGAIRWTPRADQLGTEAFTLRVLDGRGGTDSTPVTIVVRGGNLPPHFDSTPPTEGRAGKALTYTPLTTDPDHDPVAVTLTKSTTYPGFPQYDMTFDGSVFRWTPPPGTAQTFDVELTATDPFGGLDTQPFRIVVTDTNRPPSFAPVSGPPGLVNIAYSITLLATDPDGDAVTYGLDQSLSYLTRPDGSKISGSALGTLGINSGSGLLSWSVPPEIGTARVRVSASDGSLTRFAWLTVPVRLSNGAPVMTAQDQAGSTTVGLPYQYDVVATDPDNDVLTYSFVLFKNGTQVTPPAGLTVDDRGRLRWDTTGVAPDTYAVRVTAKDVFLASDTKDFTVAIGADVAAPGVSVTGSPNPVRADGTVRVAVTASDNVGVTARHLFATLPGKSEQEISLASNGTASLGAGSSTGDLLLRATATDAAGNTGQATRTVRVIPGGTGSYAPQVTLDGTFTNTGKGTVVVTGSADDPDGDLAAWDLSVRVNDTWRQLAAGTAPAAGPLATVDLAGYGDGRYPLKLTGTDATSQTGSATGTLVVVRNTGWVKDPTDNLLPIAQIAGTTKQSGNVVISGTAQDQDTPDHLQFWALDATPVGTTNWVELTHGTSKTVGPLYTHVLSDFGVGQYALRLDAFDGVGSAQDLGTLEVFADDSWQVNPPVNHKPNATLTRPTAGQVLGGAITITGTASDPDAGDTITWQLEYATQGSWNWVTINADTTPVTAGPLGTLGVVGLPDGLYPVRLTVTDQLGLASTDTFNLFVGDDKGWVPVSPPPGSRPTADITAPATGTKLADGTAPVTGTVTNPGGTTLLGWRLDARRGAETRRLAGGTGAVSAGTFATLDPTALPDGDYTVTLTAYDVAGIPATDMTAVTIAGGKLKLGNFTLAFTDLTIPVGGIPITVNRVYDTLDADKDRDFGFGWRLELGGYKVRVHQETVGDYGGFVNGTLVDVRRADGTVDQYAFAPRQTGSIIDPYYRPFFAPVTPWTVNDLVVDQDVLLYDFSGQGRYIAIGSDLDYNPADDEFGNAYQVVEPFGLTTTLNATTGEYTRVRNRNGNELAFDRVSTVGGSIVTDIAHGWREKPTTAFEASGRSVAIDRDNFGRISSVVDPRGNAVTYDYDAAGNLTSATDRMGQLLGTYTYKAAPAHYLAMVTDALGARAVEATYDPATNRLASMKDAADNPVNLGYTVKPAADTTSTERATQTVTVPAAGPGGTDVVATVGLDKLGNPLRTVDPSGAVATSAYADPYHPDEPTKVVQVVGQPDGQGNSETNDLVTNVVYDKRTGLPRSAAGPDGATTTTYYNDLALPTAAGDPNGNYSYAGYDEKGNLVSTRTQEGVTAGFGYDSHGNLNSATRGSVATKLAYDKFGQSTGTTDPNGNELRQFYDANGNRTKSERDWYVDPINKTGLVVLTRKTEVDANDRLKYVWDEFGNKSETQYDALGRVSQTIDPHGVVTPAPLHDLRGLAVESTGPDGTVTRTVYDARGRTVYSSDPFLSGQTSYRGTHTIYDASGRVTRTERLDGLRIDTTTSGNFTSSSVGAGGTVLSVDERTYDKDTGRTLYSIQFMGSPAAAKTEFEYDVAGRQTVAWTYRDAAFTKALATFVRTDYDLGGRAVKSYDPAISGQTGVVTRPTYDGDNRVTKATLADGATATQGYDSLGRKSFDTDALSQRTDYGYDKLGHLITVTQPGVPDPSQGGKSVRPVTTYGFDVYGHQTSITDPNNHVTQFGFDQYGRSTGRTLPDGKSESTAYDAFGAPDYHIDFNGAKVDTVYDYDTGSGLGTKLGRLARTDLYNPAGTKVESISYTYDGFGHVDMVTETKGGTSRVTDADYDMEGRVVQIARPETTIHYSYDDATGQHTKTWTDKTEVDYTYDTLGRLADVIDVTGNTKTTYGYDVVGNVASVVTKQGAATLKTTTNTFDPVRHWLVGVANTDGAGNTLSSFGYTRRADGQILTATESVKQPDASVVSGTTTYTYDALNRLTKEAFDGPSGTDYTKTYTLDLVGNRTQLTSAAEGKAAETTTSVYNSRDQLTSETTGFTTITYSYDDNGSLVMRTGGGSTTTQSWDLRRRLVGATVDGVTASYLYTPDGIRSSVTEGGATVVYVIDGMGPSGYAQVVEERSGGVLMAGYVYGASLNPISMARGGVVSLYLADGHSGVRQAISLAGAVQLAQRFDAFGAAVAKAGSLISPIGYRGERFDATLGQYYLRARFYDPRTGRFTSMDPFAGNTNDPLQLMRYGYGGGNPVHHMDPSGQFFALACIAVFGLGGGLRAIHTQATVERSRIAGGILGAAFGFDAGFIIGFADALLATNGNIEAALFAGLISGLIGMIIGFGLGYIGVHNPVTALAIGMTATVVFTALGVTEAHLNGRDDLAVFRAVTGLIMLGIQARGIRFIRANPPPETPPVTVGDVIGNVPDGTWIHLTPLEPAQVAPGVAVGRHWVQVTPQVRALPLSHYRSGVAGPGVPAGEPNANTFAIKLPGPNDGAIFQPGREQNILNIPEFQNTVEVVPDTVNVNPRP